MAQRLVRAKQKLRDSEVRLEIPDPEELPSRLDQRVDMNGEILVLGQQDRSRWNRDRIAQGALYLNMAAKGEEFTSFHLQAEIAACHALAPAYEETDCERIIECYDALLRLSLSPVVEVNRLVALWKGRGREAAVPELGRLASEHQLDGYYPFHAVRSEILQDSGEIEDARASVKRALELTVSAPVRRYLARRLDELEGLAKHC